jgi:hypothetical protein
VRQGRDAVVVALLGKEGAMSTNLPLMDIQYVSRSTDPDRCCRDCFHFHSVAEIDDREECANFEGSCLGVTVNADGVCRMFARRSAIELAH